MRTKTIFIARAAVIAALYAALTLMLMPFGYGPIQLRLSEALTILPLFYLEAIPGLTIGCFLANLASPMPWDMLLGTAATLIAAILTRQLKKIYFGVLPPVLVNALVVPLMFILGGDTSPYYINVLTIFVSQAVVIGVFGTALYFLLKPHVKKLKVLQPITWAELRGKRESSQTLR